MKNKFLLIAFSFIITQIGISQTIEQYIQSSSDDAEQKYDGSDVILASSDIELMYDTWNDQQLQTVGLRFTDMSIPEKATINNAYIQFTADGSSSGNLTINIKGEDVSNSSSFSDTFNNISNRTTTTAEVSWTLSVPWSDDQAGLEQRTPDLSAIISEIVSSNGWKSGNSISFILNGNGDEDNYREAISYDKNPLKSAKLVVDFTSNYDVDLVVTSIVSPGNFSFPNPSTSVQVEILSYGKLEANTYELSLFINNNIIATEPGTVPLSVGQSTMFTFAQTADLSNIGSHYIKVEVNIVGDEDLSNNAVSKTINLIEEIDEGLFMQGSAWRYWDAPTDPGSEWYNTFYADSLWSIGMGHFGFGDGDELTETIAGLVSYYFRKKIDLPDMSLFDDIYMHLIHDDAAIVYINGREALRTELMPLGNINHFTEAKQRCNSSNDNQFYTYKLDQDLFVNGINTIAISVRNVNGGSDNSSFDCYLTSDFQYDQDGPFVFYEGDNIIVEEVTPEGIISNTYTQGEDIELTCTLPHINSSFSFPLKTKINIEPSEYNSTPSKFLSISDFHGHIEAFTMILRGEDIIDENFNWIYGDGHLIISGDLFDRGFHITECMWLLYKLETEAEVQGGKVHLIIGNHEMFNITDDWRYVEVKYFNSAHLLGKRMLELYDADTELGRWLRSKNIIERIGDYAFMHGGISPEVASLNLSYNEINEFGRREMEGSCFSSACKIVTGSDGVYWYRGLAYQELSQAEVDDIVTGLNVERIIIGHTKDVTVRSLYDGRVIAIDMYHIDNFEDGYMEALQFELGCFYIFHTEANISNNTYTLLDDCDDYTNVLNVNMEGQLRVYPNPTGNTLNIQLPKHMKAPFDYSIISMDGKVMCGDEITTDLATVNLTGLGAGKYHLVLQNGNSRIIGYFILVK